MFFLFNNIHFLFHIIFFKTNNNLFTYFFAKLKCFYAYILLILLSSFRLNAKNLKLIFQLMKNNVKITLNLSINKVLLFS